MDEKPFLFFEVLNWETNKTIFENFFQGADLDRAEDYLIENTKFRLVQIFKDIPENTFLKIKITTDLNCGIFVAFALVEFLRKYVVKDYYINSILLNDNEILIY